MTQIATIVLLLSGLAATVEAASQPTGANVGTSRGGVSADATPRPAEPPPPSQAATSDAPAAGDSANPAPHPLTTHTVTFPGGTPARATLAEVAWLVGSWRGTPDAQGTWGEEVWVPAAGGAMAAVFRLLRGDEVLFYELVLLREVDAGLVLELKHFHADLTGWEERDEVRRFPLLALGPNEARFDGLTYRLEDPDTLVSWVAITAEGTPVRELELRFRRSE